MAELCSASDSHPNPPDNLVFIDTSLDTHIAVIVSNDDTVADVKKKILLEHGLCYSSTGKIKIHALKVKRRGCFYRLPDSMFIRRAFDGIKKGTWFLSVDASSLVEQSENQLPCNPDSGNLLLYLPSADGVDLQPDEPYKELPIHIQSPVPQIKANESASEKVLSDHLKVAEMEVKHNSDDHHKTSLEPNKSELEETCNLFHGEIELPGAHRKCKKDDNGSLEGDLKTEPAPKKRQKIKNKRKDALYDHALKECNAPVHASGKDTSQNENVISEDPLGNTGVQVSNDLKMQNDQLSDHPDEKSSSETSKRSDYGLQNKDDLCEEVQVQGALIECQDIKLKDTIDVQCNSSLGEILQPRPAAKKKQKIVKSRESEGPVKENEVKDNEPLICTFDKETSRAKIGSTENTLENKQDIINSNLDGLPPQLPEPECLIAGSSIGKKKRKKQSSDPFNQVVPEVPPEKDVRQESSKATVEVNHKDSGRESDTTIVPGESIQNANHSRTCAPSLNEKYSDPVQVVEIPSLSPVIDMNEADASNVGRTSAASELVAAYEVKRKKSSKKHRAVDGKGHSVKELSGLRKDLDPSVQESAALAGNDQKAEIDITNKIDGESNISLKNDPNRSVSEKFRSSRSNGLGMNMKVVIAPSNILEANVGVEHQKLAVKRRNSKKSKHSVEGTQDESNMEHAKHALNGFALAEHHKALDGNHSTKDSDKGESVLSETERTQALHTKVGKTSLLGADREIDVPSGNEMESFHQARVSKTQENSEDMMEDKPAVKRRNSKKSKHSVEGTQNESNMEHAKHALNGFALAEHHKALDGNHSTKDSDKGESVLSETERTQALHTKVGKTSLLGADREIDVPSGNEMESFHHAHVSKTQENTEVMMEDKPAVKRRNSKKSKHSVEGTQDESNMEHAKHALNGFALTEHHKALDGNHSTKDSDKGESVLSETERTQALHTKVGKTSLLGADRDIDVPSGNEMESFHQARVSKTQENSEDMMEDKPAVKRRNSKKSKHSVEGTQDESNMEHAKHALNGFALAEHHKALDGNHSTKDSDKGESVLSETERTQALHTKVGKTSLLGADRDIDVPSGNEMESFHQARVSKTQENSEDMMEDKPAVKRRNSKKSKHSVEGTQDESNMEHAKHALNGFALAEHHKALDGNHSTKDSDKGESVLSETERTQALHTKVGKTSLSGADREIDVPSGNEMESFHQAHASKTQENTEVMMDDKLRKKTKKRQSSTAKNPPELEMKEQNVDPEVSTSAHQFKVNVLSKIKRKSKSVKTKLDTEKEAGTEVESLHLKQDSGNFDSSQIPSSDAPENNSVGEPLKANGDGDLLRLGGINEARGHKDVSSCQSDAVNIPKSLLEVAPPAQVLDDKETKVKKSESEPKVNKNKKLPNARAVATSHDLQCSLNTNRRQGAETKVLGDNELQDPLSMDVSSKLVPDSDSKFSKVSRKGLKSTHDEGKFDKSPEEVRWPKVVNASGTSSPVHTFMEENGEASLSTSSSDSSDSSEDGINYQNKRRKHQSDLDRYRVTIRKAHHKNTGEVVNSSQQSKSLLATYGSIFNDGGSGSSEDDNDGDASDASTRTPSDSSASSDCTEGQSRQHLDLSPGLYSAKRNESGAKDIAKSNSAASKNVAMDVILRSSSRYKKAKLTAQAEVNDSESQPIEFVPDSQAN